MAMFMHPLVAARSTGPRLYGTPIAGLGSAPLACGNNGKPLLKQGVSSPCVQILRNLLASHGFARKTAPLAANTYDSGDFMAVYLFQQAKGLRPVDGIVGKDTWAALLTRPQATPEQPLGPPVPLGLEVQCPQGTRYEGSDAEGRLICTRGGAPEQPPTITPKPPRPVGPGPLPPAPPDADKPEAKKTWKDRLKDPKTLLLGAGGLLVAGGLAWALWPSKEG